MSYDAIKWAFAQDAGSAPAALVLLALARSANRDGLAWPSGAKLAASTRLDRKTITRALAVLVRKGIIFDTGQRMGETGRVRVFRLATEQIGLPLGEPKRNRKRADLNGQQSAHIRAGSKGTQSARKRNVSVFPANRPESGPLSSSKEKESSNEDSQKTAPKDTAAAQCAAIFEAWNVMAKANGLATAAKLTEDRRRNLKARLKDHSSKTITDAIRRIPQSAFLLGDNDRGWKPTFDFLLRPASLNRLIEGAYDRGPRGGGDTPLYRLINQGRA